MRFKHFLYMTSATAALLASAQSRAAQTATPTPASDGAPSAGDQAGAAPSRTGADVDAEAAQADGGQSPSSGRARVEERGDVVVTGNRFEKVLSQPQSKSVIDAEQRNLAGIGNIRTIIDVQPGINYSDTFGLNVRGVGRQTPQTLLGQENTVIQYVDGFINLVPSNISESTLFGGNIQFLRGPAGTTYGRNALAGAVNLVSRAPTKEFTAEVEAGGGRAGYFDVGANIAGPITDNLGFRLGLQEFNMPSIQKNLGTTLDSDRAGFAVKNRYFEFQLEWRPGPFHIRNRFTTFDFDNQPGYPSQTSYNTGTAFNPALNAGAGVGVPVNTFGATGNPGGIFLGLAPNPQFQYAGPVPSQPYQINVNYAGYDRLRGNIQDIVNADVDLGFANLVYIGGFQKYLATGSSDLDLTSRTSFDPFAVDSQYNAPIAPVFAPGTIIPTDYRVNYRNDDSFWSSEARLESKPGKRLGYVLGYYHFEQDFDEYYNNAIANATTVAPFSTALLNPGSSLTVTLPTGTLPAPNPNAVTFEQRNIYHIRSNAVFGNATFDLSDRLRFDGGLRYTWDKKDALTNFRFVFYYPPLFAADDTPPTHSASPNRLDRGLSGRGALAYRFSGGSQIYASYSRGYQSSAFTLGQGLPGPDPANPQNIAKSEHLDVYELGGNLNAGRIRFDASGFYENFFNQQIPIFAQLLTPGVLNGQPIVTTTTFTRFTNAPRSEIYGGELQATWHPTDHANIIASYTYLHPTFRTFSGIVDILNTAAGPQNVAGNVIPRTPRNKATLYGYYGVNLGKLGYLYPGGSVAYQSSFYTQPFKTPYYYVPGRAIVGLTLTYRSPNEHLDITGSVLNAFRHYYSDNGGVQIVGTTISNVTSYGQDRYWTVTARYRF